MLLTTRAKVEEREQRSREAGTEAEPKTDGSGGNGGVARRELPIMWGRGRAV